VARLASSRVELVPVCVGRPCAKRNVHVAALLNVSCCDASTGYGSRRFICLTWLLFLLVYVSIVGFIGAPQSGPPRPLAAAVSTGLKVVLEPNGRQDAAKDRPLYIYV
jgi:hypothetical protein